MQLKINTINVKLIDITKRQLNSSKKQTILTITKYITLVRLITLILFGKY